ncbi:MAG TPA: hypothetical protein V6C81_31750 [Planktothrix sp.]|jgi:hypothetical protein
MSDKPLTHTQKLHIIALQLPMVSVRRIPSKLEKALKALKTGDATEFTRQIDVAAELHNTARQVHGNANSVGDYCDQASRLARIVDYVLTNFKHVVFAVGTTLGRSKNAESIELSDGYAKPYKIDDSQSVEAVRALIAGLVELIRSEIKAAKQFENAAAE